MSAIWITPLEPAPGTTRWEVRTQGRPSLTFLGTWPLLAMSLRQLLLDRPDVSRLIFVDVDPASTFPVFHAVSEHLLEEVRTNQWVTAMWDLFAWSPEILADKPSRALLENPEKAPEYAKACLLFAALHKQTLPERTEQ